MDEKELISKMDASISFINGLNARLARKHVHPYLVSMIVAEVNHLHDILEEYTQSHIPKKHKHIIPMD